MLATIELIEEVKEHSNADSLEIVTVRGYQCIVRKDFWQVGDKCILIQPDTVLPDAEWADIYRKSNRVKAIRLRGEWSFGIVESLGLLPHDNFEVGDEVGDILGITKYEIPEPQQLDAKRSTLPFNMPKTDEERWQNLRNIPYGERILVTLKVDGQSATYYYKDSEFGVTGRRMEYKPEMKNRYTDHIARYDLENKLRGYCEKHGVNLALRGESYGEGIQQSSKNPHSKMKPQIAFFSVWLIDEMRYAGLDDEHNVWAVCDELDLPTVPVIEETILTKELIDHYSQIKTLNGQYFEGVVLQGNDFSFKVINLEYDSRK